MKTIKIKGKDYIEVKERVKEFRRNEFYKGWAIKTVIDTQNMDRVVCHAVIENNNGRTISTGSAYEERTESHNVNNQSWLENCETSAVGRALGFLGIGIDVAIASYDEMTKGKPEWWRDAILYLNGGGTMDSILSKYELSEELQKQLMEDAISAYD